MKKTSTAVLLSAFVFPGSGHFYLRSYVRGLALTLIAAVALFGFVQRAWHEAEIISTQVVDEINTSGAIDLEALIAHASTATEQIDQKPFTIAGTILLIAWLAGIIDSYVLGKKISASTSLS